MKRMLFIALGSMLLLGLITCGDDEAGNAGSGGAGVEYYVGMTLAGNKLKFGGGFTDESLGGMAFTNASLVKKPFGTSVPGSIRFGVAFGADCSYNTYYSQVSNNFISFTFPATNSTICNTGTYTNAYNVQMVASINGQKFISVPPVSFTITEFGDEGGNISGYFSCMLSNTNIGVVSHVNDGVFHLRSAHSKDAILIMMLSWGSP